MPELTPEGQSMTLLPALRESPDAPPRPVHEFLVTDPTRTQPCYRCGTLVHPVRSPVDWDAPEFAICPLSDQEGCDERERARRAAEREREAAAAVTEAPAGEDSSPPVRKNLPRRRPSQARKTLLGAARPPKPSTPAT